jgi:hypothetical protein
MRALLYRLVILFLKEELRLRSRFSPAFSLFFFPQIVMVAAMAGYLLHPLVLERIEISTLHFSVDAGLFMFGMTMGGMAFLGKDFVERAIGPVTMIAASTRFQPVEDRRMFFAYFIHDLAFFMGLILVPLTIGMAIGCLVLPIEAGRFIFLNACYWTAFIQGLSLSLCISACMTNGKRVMLLLIPVFFVPLFASQAYAGDPRGFSTTYLAIVDGSIWWLALSLALSAVYTASGVWMYKGSGQENGSRSTWSYNGARGFAKVTGYRGSPVLGREMLNLVRGKAYLGIGFSLFVPLIILTAFTGIVSNVGNVPFGFNGIFFSVMVSIFTVSIYNGLVSLDSLDFDQTIPLDVPTLVRAKIRLHLLFALPIWAVITIIICIVMGDWMGIAVGLPVGLVTVVYMGYATAYLTGLWTNSMLFDASIFLRYVTFTILPVLYATILSYTIQKVPIPSIGALVIYVILVIFAIAMIDRGIDERWKDRVLTSAGSV